MSDHQKISPTAWLVAKARSKYTDIPYSQEIDKVINTQSTALSMKITFAITKLVAKLLPKKITMLTTIEGRHLAINDCLPKDNNFCLIEFAAGLSPRGINYAQKGCYVIETDLPHLTNVKEHVLKNFYQNEQIPDNHQIFTVNVLHRESLTAVGKLYEKNGKNRPIYIVHEGMAQYLIPEEKEILRDNIAWFLNRYAPKKGYWITTDFSIIRKKNLDKESSAPLKFILSIIQNSTKRKLESFTSEKDLDQYLSKSKLVQTPHPNEYLLKKLSILQKINLSEESAATVLDQYIARVIQPSQSK